MVVSITTLFSLIVWIMIIGAIAWLFWWLIGYVALPEPFNKIARVVVAVIAVLILVNLLLGLVGEPVLKLK